MQTSNQPPFVHGQKRVTIENWLEGDQISWFGFTPEEWLAALAKPQLSKHVPQSIKKLFEASRGAMAYGWFHRAILNLASDQIFRVCELAAIRRADRAGITTAYPRNSSEKKPRNRPFSDIVKDLEKGGIINGIDVERWNGFVKGRNTVSHPKTHTQALPEGALGVLTFSCACVNNLFNSKAVRDPLP